MDAVYFFINLHRMFPVREQLIPWLGTFHSQRGNNLQPYFFFFVEI